MSDIVIRTENLSKLYHIGERKGGYKTLRETIVNTFSASFRHLGRNPQISDFAPQPGHIWALKDISFEVSRGEVVGIIGRNGAGKTTLLKILSRITEPTEGWAEIRGRIGSLLEVGTGFHPELTGRENIYLNGAILGMKRVELDRKFDEIVAFAEIEKFIDTPVKRYSSGMYVRLAFAVAAHLEPEILLVDEVLAVGDVAFQKRCLGKMGDVAKEGRTVLFVSHNMGAVSSLCEKTIYLANSKIRSIGPSEQIMAAYLSETFPEKIDNLEHLRPPLTEYGKDIRFCDVSLLSADGKNLLSGEPIKLALTIWSDLDMKDLSIGCTISNVSGAGVGTLFTKQTFSIRADQRLTLCLTISNINLAPGSYYGGFSIGRGGKTSRRNDLDIVIGTPAFQVLPFSSDGDPIADWSPKWGNIMFVDIEMTIER